MAGELFLSGLTGTNFDGGAIVDQIMQLKSLPLQRLQQEKALVQAKLSSLGNLSKGIGDFLSLFEGLDVDSLFKAKQATSSNPDVLIASATDEAPNLSFSVNVNKLAQAEVRVTNGGFADLTGTFASSGTLTITYETGSGTETFDIDYNAGETLEDLVNSINNAQDRVKASIYYDGTSYKLMLSENDLGGSNVETDVAGNVYVIGVSGLPSELGTGLDTIQSAQNAEIVIGSGSPVVSPTNEFENVISGLTIEVKDIGSANVSVSENYSKVTSFLEDFVKQYNGLVKLVDSLTVGEQALFRGDYTIASVKTGVAERLDPLIEEGLIDYNGDTGEISLKTDRLNELLNTDPEKVKGLIEDLKSSYSSYLEGEKDLFSSFEQTYNEQIEDIDSRIQSLANRLVQEEQSLRREYAQLEAFIAQAEELRQRFQQFIVTLSEMTKGGNK
ncbi:flagellar hook-associated protein 2 [Hydrogenivirga caldilitoris]|uniref:Flagellar hook-associated protein 2 n=1 Tax=Hydrogenivirga caldilitoris TaxID=246264 RepID=A0A497XLV7_9AQUI|nr:flagellar filament capping protein FliD [Hydrogenivirga caldilitoris]RLJ69768.1 flagellar hook-associated protein 2 [Hydrogenivirga caldilitoris]